MERRKFTREFKLDREFVGPKGVKSLTPLVASVAVLEPRLSTWRRV